MTYLEFLQRNVTVSELSDSETRELLRYLVKSFGHILKDLDAQFHQGQPRKLNE